MRPKLVVLVLAVAMLTLASTAEAASSWSGGDLRAVARSQLGFGGSPDRNRYGRAEIVGFDGRGGTYVRGTSGNWDGATALFRFNPDGKPDETFNQRIKPRFGRNSSVAVVGDRVLITKGKQVIAFTPEGLMDQSFGQNGRLVLKRFTHQVFALGDSRFYLVSAQSRYSLSRVRLERYDSVGKLRAATSLDGGQWFAIKDVSASGDVAYVTGWDPGDYGSVEELHVVKAEFETRPVQIDSVEYTEFGDVNFLSDGNLLMDQDGNAVAVNQNGKRVLDFGDDGILRCTSTVDPLDQASPVRTAVDQSGRIIGIGSFGGSACGLQRFLGSGNLDNSFDYVSASDAASTIPGGFPSDLEASTERIILTFWDVVSGGPGLLAIKNDGQIDGGFGSAGKSSGVLLSPDSSKPTASIRDAEGKILVAGLNRSADGRTRRLALARFGRNGRVDRSFGHNGRLRLDLGNKVISVDLTRLKSGPVMVSGTLRSAESGDSGFLMRLTAGGRIDPDFGDNGLRRIDAPGHPSTSFVGSATFGNGLLVTGSVCCSANTGQDALVAAFDRDGRPVTSFGEDGFVIRDLLEIPADKEPAGDKDQAIGLDLDANGQPVILAETTPRSSGPDPTSFGLTDKGRKSSLFGGRTIRVPAFWLYRDGVGEFYRWPVNLNPTGLEVLASGRILYVLGREGRATSRWSGAEAKTIGHLTLLDRKGDLVRSFGKSGQVTNWSLSFQDIALDRCGRILVAGSSEKKSIFSFGLARYHLDGRQAGAAPRGKLRFSGPNSLERGMALTVVGGRAFVTGTLAPEYWSTSFGFAGFRAGGKCGQG